MILHVLLGVLAGAVVIALVRRVFDDSLHFYASALLVAQLILLGFALGSGRGIGLEIAGVALFALLAWLGRSRPVWAGVGWLAHGPWDLLLHSPGPEGHVPLWYLSVCLGFDLLLGAYILFQYRTVLFAGPHRPLRNPRQPQR